MQLSPEIRELKATVRSLYGCECIHIESIPVMLTREGETPAEAATALEVEAFALVRHPQAKHAYAWSWREGAEPKAMAVLKLPPVDGAEAAVKMALRAQN